MASAYFERFCIELPDDCVLDCSGQGDATANVESWARRIERPQDCTVDKLRAELKEYGAWGAEELADDGANWQRIIWIAACNVREMERATERAGG